MAEIEAPHHYKFNIQMNCGGCSGAIDRVLKKTEGEHHRHGLVLYFPYRFEGAIRY